MLLCLSDFSDRYIYVCVFVYFHLLPWLLHAPESVSRCPRTSPTAACIRVILSTRNSSCNKDFRSEECVHIKENQMGRGSIHKKKI